MMMQAVITYDCVDEDNNISQLSSLEVECQGMSKDYLSFCLNVLKSSLQNVMVYMKKKINKNVNFGMSVLPLQNGVMDVARGIASSSQCTCNPERGPVSGTKRLEFL